MADLTKLKREIKAELREHQLDEFETCKCEPGYVQGPDHIVDAIMHVIEENIIIHG